jgi:hypothetical protein
MGMILGQSAYIDYHYSNTNQQQLNLEGRNLGEVYL